MKKISLGMCLVLMTSIFVCAMSKPSKNVPTEPTKPAETVVPAVKSVAGKIPEKLRAYLLTGLPKAMTQIVSADNKVDVLVTFEAIMKNGNKQNVTVTLLQDLNVLKVGTDDKDAYLVLALSPRDAQYLALAQKEGDVSVIVRPTEDKNHYLMEIATFEKLFN